jgi:galactose mutarotase-like enzyme
MATETPRAAAPREHARAIEIHAGQDRAGVQLKGAQWCSWLCNGRELLWSGDPRWWPRHSPLLFPAVGHLRGGQAWFSGSPHPMVTHGFASSMPFAVREQAADRVTLSLRSDDRTCAAYPFEFELIAQYRLAPNEIDVELSLRNAGQTSMPYSIGLHPAFHWPWLGGDATGHTIVFSDDEVPHVPVITKEGLFTTARRPVPLDGRRLPLTPSLLANEALCFIDARSRRLAFEAPDGSEIEIEARGFLHWALWRPPGAPLLSVEAWTGHGDAHDFQGEFSSRLSTLHLAPGELAHHGLHLRYRAAEDRS